MKSIAQSVVAAALVAASSVCLADDISKWDPRMAADNAVVDTNGVKWIDGRYLPIEGRWTLGDAPEFYSRLPNTLTTNVNGGVRSMRRHTTGMQFRFQTDSNFLVMDMKLGGRYEGGANMCTIGTSGWDLYQFDKSVGKWRFVTSSHRSKISENKSRVVLKTWIKPNVPCLVNLPLYNSVDSFRIGFASRSSVSALGPRTSGVEKPVVFYGTSITHGGCANRPGLSFVNIVGRDLDVPVYNLGFSGSGIMELELADVIAKVDASCYVLDCLWNMGFEATARRRGEPHIFSGVAHNYEPFIRRLRELRPDTPIVMAEQCDDFYRPGVNNSRFKDKNDFIAKLYAKLVAEGWKNLHYLKSDDMGTPDTEGTVDGTHPNDIGMRRMADVFGLAVKKALNLK